MSLFRLIFLMTLAPAAVLGLRRGGDSALCALVLLMSFGSTFLAWPSGDPVFLNAAFDATLALIVALSCESREAAFLGILFAIAAAFSLIFGVTGWASGEYHFLYANGLSAVGHAQNIWVAWWGRGLDQLHLRSWQMGRRRLGAGHGLRAADHSPHGP